MSAAAPIAGTKARSVTAALVMLMLINAVNYADRGVLSLMQVPIKKELGLSDFAIGLLIGPAFAIFYAVMGIPVARLAERFDRSRIIIVAVAIWSLFTGACGTASSFVQLALWRMGMGAAEAGAPPATHALIADYFPQSKRGRAMAIMTIGLPLGSFYGNMTSGFVAGALGWRVAFFAAAVPGLILALLCTFLLFEPRRHAVPAAAKPVQPGGASVMTLLRSPAMLMLVAIALLSGFVGNALPNNTAAFFMRAHGLTLPQAGVVTAIGAGVCGALGAWTSGYLADRLDKGDGKAYYLVPAISTTLSGILAVTAYWMGGTAVAIGFYWLSAFCGIMMISPTFAALQNVVDPRNRATAAAIYLFCITVAGAAGLALTGLLSDIIGGSHLGLGRTAYAAACPGGKAATAAITQAMCAEAGAIGLRTAMTCAALIYFLLLPLYLLAGRVAQPELEARRAATLGETSA